MIHHIFDDMMDLKLWSRDEKLHFLVYKSAVSIPVVAVESREIMQSFS